MARCAIRVLLLWSLVAIVGPPARPVDKPSDLQARFEAEPNSVRQAKLFEKLGDAQFAEARHASLSRDFNAVAQIMEKYRDNARIVLIALKKQRPDAERQMGGYKQLQIHIHRALRELDESLLVSPAEFKPPLHLVRQDLLSMDGELLQLLFPHRPDRKKAAPPAAASETHP